MAIETGTEPSNQTHAAPVEAEGGGGGDGMGVMEGGERAADLAGPSANQAPIRDSIYIIIGQCHVTAGAGRTARRMARLVTE